MKNDNPFKDYQRPEVGDNPFKDCLRPKAEAEGGTKGLGAKIILLKIIRPNEHR